MPEAATFLLRLLPILSDIQSRFLYTAYLNKLRKPIVATRYVLALIHHAIISESYVLVHRCPTTV